MSVALLAGLGGWWWTIPTAPLLETGPTQTVFATGPTPVAPVEQPGPTAVTAWILWVVDERWSSTTSVSDPADEHTARPVATFLDRATCEMLADLRIKAVLSAISFIGARLVGNTVVYAVDRTPSATRFVCEPGKPSAPDEKTRV